MNTLRDYVDWKLTHSDKTAEAEGYPLVLEKCKSNKKMKELKVYGDSEYDRKNLIFASGENVTSTNSVICNNSTIQIDGLYSSNVSFRNKYYDSDQSAFLKKNTPYTFTLFYVSGEIISLGNNGLVFGLYSAESKWLGYVSCRLSNYQTNASFTIIPEKNIRVSFWCTGNGEFNNLIYNFQVEEGSVSTEYEEFKPATPDSPVEILSIGEKTINLYNHSTAKAIAQWNASMANAKFEAGTITSITNSGDSGGFLLVKVGNASDYRGKTVSCTWKPKTGNINISSTSLCIYDANNSRVQDSSPKTLDNGYFHNILSIPETIADTDNLAFRLYFNPGQKGDTIAVDDIMLYESEEPRPYEPYGKYKIPIVQRGKNLLNPTVVSTESFFSDAYISNDKNSYGTVLDSTDLTDNKVVINQTENPDYANNPTTYNNGYFCIQDKGLEVGKKYILSFDIDISSNPLGATNIAIFPDGTYPTYYASFSQNKQRVSTTFVEARNSSTAKPPYMEIRCMGMSFTASNFMITEEGYDTEFEPYVEPQTHNVYLDEPLRRFGDYADIIDFKNKKVIRNMYEEVFKGTESDWSKFLADGTLNSFRFPLSRGGGNMASVSVFQNGMCNKYPVVSGRKDKTCSGGATGGTIVDFHDNSIELDVNAWKAYLAEEYAKGTPLKFLHTLATPKEEQIDYDFPKLTEKTTVFEVDATISPSNMYGKYIKR